MSVTQENNEFNFSNFFKKTFSNIKLFFIDLFQLDYESYLKAKLYQVKDDYIKELKDGKSDFIESTVDLPRELLDEIIEDVINNIIKKTKGVNYNPETDKIDL